MTPEQIEIAREAMALPGAPCRDESFIFPSQHKRIHDGMEPIHVWDISDTSPAGWALGGVLLGALGNLADVLVFYGVNEWRIEGEDCAYPLSDACCRVALSVGHWPGGLKHD